MLDYDVSLETDPYTVTTEYGSTLAVNASIDYDNVDFPNVIYYNKGTKILLKNIGIFLPVVMIGLIGNFWVIYVLKSNRYIRTPTNLIVGNMAVADSLSLLMHPCFIFVYDYFQNYQLGSIGCKGEGPLECSILMASVISMSAITYDRLISILLPNETRINQTKAKIVIFCTWLIGIVLSVPLAIFRTYKERQWKNFDETYCTENVVVINVYWYVIITVLVWLPLSIQIICYSAIFIKLNRYEKMLVKSFSNHQLGYKKSAAKMMFIVILTFMVCRIPYTAFIIYRHSLLKSKKIASSASVTNLVNGLYHTLWFTSKYLLIVNAALNPLIYSATNISFRNAFKKTKLWQWLIPKTKENRIKRVIKEKAQISPTTEAAKCNKKIFYIFKRKQNIKSVGGQEPSTKEVEVVYNTKL
ncbi:substance-K receptor-like [Sitophilus oryzae]|uniref:Substance-K receptor-like n=1 Tax=Sitophilus oryzae TaxID=7048 RepID=A0A6J2Y4D3_SITOR|nr:substance-K receptor-like [Sitophilus oryzae]